MHNTAEIVGAKPNPFTYTAMRAAAAAAVKRRWAATLRGAGATVAGRAPCASSLTEPAYAPRRRLSSALARRHSAASFATFGSESIDAAALSVQFGDPPRDLSAPDDVDDDGT